MSSYKFSALSRLLFGEAAALEERARLASGPQVAARDLNELLRSSSTAWPALEAFLRNLAAERVPTLVYGDYDVDGSISVFLLQRWLRGQGVPGNIFLPSRFQHGYGLDSGIIRRAAEQGYRALIALDCGTANLEEIAMAREAGMHVAVIDHHRPKDALPEAVLLNPHLDAALPPLCTAGLVFGLLCALDPQAGAGLPADALCLAGLATQADIVPLVPLSWSLAHHALYELPGTHNFGLAELLKVSRLHGLSRITGRQIAFDLAPRLNAAGRMQSARLVPELLAAGDPQAARALALRIDALNQERRDTGRRVAEEAAAQALTQSELAGLVLADPRWHPGVLGIAAARVAGQFGKPCIVLGAAPAAAGEEGQGLLSGSVRSAGNVDVVAALEAVGSVLVSFGGHAAAAGVKVLAAQLPALRQLWSDAVTRQAEGSGHDEALPVDAPSVKLADLSAEFESDVWLLAPFGPQHPAPRFRLSGGRLLRADYMGADRTHLSLTLSDSQRQLRIAAFNQSHLYDKLRPGQELAPLVECDADNWNNRIGIALSLLEL